MTEQIADKGYHSRTTVHDLEILEIRSYISEPDPTRVADSVRWDSVCC